MRVSLRPEGPGFRTIIDGEGDLVLVRRTPQADLHLDQSCVEHEHHSFTLQNFHFYRVGGRWRDKWRAIKWITRYILRG